MSRDNSGPQMAGCLSVLLAAGLGCILGHFYGIAIGLAGFFLGVPVLVVGIAFIVVGLGLE